nr:hypothetical protein Iba_chr04cCG12860 [Ipomoea batatas]
MSSGVGEGAKMEASFSGASIAIDSEFAHMLILWSTSGRFARESVADAAMFIPIYCNGNKALRRIRAKYWNGGSPKSTQTYWRLMQMVPATSPGVAKMQMQPSSTPRVVVKGVFSESTALCHQN